MVGPRTFIDRVRHSLWKNFISTIFVLIFTFIPTIAYSDFQLGAGYSFMIYDLGLEELPESNPPGHAVGITGAYKFERWSIEGQFKKVNLETVFRNNSETYSYALDDTFWAIGFKRTFWVPSFFFKGGFSMHDLETRLNGSTAPTTDFTALVLNRGTGKKPAFYFGMGGEWQFFNFLVFTDGTFYKFSNATLYDWMIGLGYVF